MPDPIFLVGCSRAGTTVTYETLAAAPGVRSVGYELPQLWHRLHGPAHNGWHSEAAGRADARPEHREAALRFLYERLGAGLIVDKTCINVLRVPYLHALFPQARFVFIHRDGRANVSSLMDGWRDGRFALGQFLGPPPEEVAIENGAFREWHFFLPPGWRDYNHASLAEACAHQWTTANHLALEARAGIPEDQWVRIRYEDLLDRPVALFREVFEKLDLPFTDELQQRCATLAERPTSLVAGAPKRDKWREHNGDAIERILPMISPLMQELGYDPAA
ncbi:sulfotransferase family protein [Spiribacter halobius]|uniref:Sulfotransferase n=1 Tax=Sediminicurvatus halobius TaxID=2182432 RepID=A0A2U2MXM2_9GAMM|nr:sulfotransferase [Spiribacter halobius]PWG61715.1 sulfotransferase [Spiribacter halobius]UEX77339.1 sulfotransferase [Spiribacter halobius]